MRKRILNYSILNSSFNHINIIGTADSCPTRTLTLSWGLLRVGRESAVPLHIIKLCKHLYAILMVAHAACLTTAVHGEDGIAHIDTTQGY